MTSIMRSILEALSDLAIVNNNKFHYSQFLQIILVENIHGANPVTRQDIITTVNELRVMKFVIVNNDVYHAKYFGSTLWSSHC